MAFNVPEGWSFGDILSGSLTINDMAKWMGEMAIAELMGIAPPEKSPVGQLAELREQNAGSPVIPKFTHTLQVAIRSMRVNLDHLERDLIDAGFITDALPNPDSVVVPDTIPYDWG